MVVHSKRQSLHLHWTAERKIRQILQERLKKIITPDIKIPVCAKKKDYQVEHTHVHCSYPKHLILQALNVED